MENIEKIWQDYAKTRSSHLRDILIAHYSPLVKKVAGRLSMHIGQHVEFDDIVGYGVFGLLDAIEKFDVQRGYKFETYATLRIKGEIIDNIRKMDWIPRSIRQKSKMLEMAHEELSSKLFRAPTNEEMAEHLQISVYELKDMYKKSNIQSLISLEDYLEENYEKETVSLGEVETTEQIVEKKELKKMLMEALNTLTEKEKKVVILYYFEEMTLREISKTLEVSESRISQLHSRAMVKLQTKLGVYRSVLYK